MDDGGAKWKKWNPNNAWLLEIYSWLINFQESNEFMTFKIQYFKNDILSLK